VGKIEQAKYDYATCSDRLKAIIRYAFHLAEENSEAVRLILQVFFSPPLQGPSLDRVALARKRFRHIEDIMQDGLDNQEVAGGDAQSLSLVFLGVMDMHVMAKTNRPETRLSDELADGLVDLFFSGVQYREKPATALVSPYAF
jgi:hypothetical protein